MSTIVDRFARCHRRDPDRPILHLPASGESLTAGTIWQAHLDWAQRLSDAGLRPGHVLIAAAGNRAATVPLFLAARACGLVWMPVDSGATAAEIAELERRYGAAATVLPGERSAASEALSANVVVGHGLAAAKCYPAAAVMKLTSGSTDVPKATLTSDDQLVSDTTQLIAGMGLHPRDTQLAVIPLSHAYGLSVLLMPLLLQGTAIVLRETFAPDQLPLDAEQFAANSFPGVPLMFQHFLSMPPHRWPSSITRILSAGAPLPLEVARRFRERFGVKVRSFYGTTESGGITYDGGDDENQDTVGTPLPGVTVTLVPDDSAPAGSGRIHVRSAGVSSGYAHGDGDGFGDGGYLTGDYGAFDDRGHLRLTGRVSSFVNVAGRKVRPLEVEQVLRSMPGIRDAHVLPGSDPRRGEQVVACIVPDPAGGAPAPVDVRRFCWARLAAHKIPRAFIFLPQLPLTARGKVDRQVLETLVRAELDRSQRVP